MSTFDLNNIIMGKRTSSNTNKNKAAEPASNKPAKDAQAPEAKPDVKDDASDDIAKVKNELQIERNKAGELKQQLAEANESIAQKDKEIDLLEQKVEDWELKVFSKSSPNVQEEVVQSVTSVGKQVELNSKEGKVDLQNVQGLIVARGVPVKEAAKRIKNSNGKLSVIEKEEK